MKKLYVALSLYLTPLVILSQARWDGEAMNQQWNDPLNWVGDQLPQPGDEVLLDHSIVVGNYTVELPAGNESLSLSRLVLSPTAPDSIRLILPSANTSSTALVMSGAGDVLLLKRNAVFINASGASSGTPVSIAGDGFFRIENGAHYIHQTERGHTTGLVSRLASGAGTEEGIFQFNVPGGAAYTVSVSNRIYGHLIFSCPTPGITKTYTGAGVSPLQIQSHLTIKSNAVFSYGSNVSSIRIAGDCVVDQGGSFNIANGTNNSLIVVGGNLLINGRLIQTGAATGSVLRMAGTLHQHIKGKGTWSGSIRLQIENPNHVTTDDTLWLPADLELAAGKIIVSENALLGMSAESQINYTPENFIEGSLALCGESMLQFPVGAGGIFAPLQVSAGGNRTDTFIAKYFRGNPQSTAGIAGPVASPIENLSAVEYWKLESQTTAARKISLFAGLTSFVQNPETMLVAGNEGGQWVSRGLSLFESTAQQSPWVCGFVHAEEASTAYSWFTLASKDGNPVNPLPVKLMSFATRMLYDGILQISWLCSEDVAPGTRFRLYRNEAGQRELILDSITGSGTPSRQFYYLHQLSNPGHYTFYLEMVDPVYGKQVSALRTVQWLPYATAFINVFPNPATTRLWLRWESGPQPFYLRIINSMGQTISLKKMAGSMGVRDYLVDVSKLPAGWYRFEVSRGNIPLAVCSVVVRR